MWAIKVEELELMKMVVRRKSIKSNGINLIINSKFFFDYPTVV